jgi:flagellar hook-basal body complex protein FliE
MGSHGELRASSPSIRSEDDMGSGMSASIALVQAQIEGDAQALSLPSIKPSVEVDAMQSGTGAGISTGFRQMIDAVNAQDHAAADKMAAVDSGRSDDLVGAMLASQEANLSFSMLMQVRNKVVGAMEDLIKLQL